MSKNKKNTKNNFKKNKKIKVTKEDILKKKSKNKFFKFYILLFFIIVIFAFVFFISIHEKTSRIDTLCEKYLEALETKDQQLIESLEKELVLENISIVIDNLKTNDKTEITRCNFTYNGQDYFKKFYKNKSYELKIENSKKEKE